MTLQITDSDLHVFSRKTFKDDFCKCSKQFRISSTGNKDSTSPNILSRLHDLKMYFIFFLSRLIVGFNFLSRHFICCSSFTCHFVSILIAVSFFSSQIFAIDLVSHLSRQYPLPKSLGVAKLAVSVMATLLNGKMTEFWFSKDKFRRP